MKNIACVEGVERCIVGDREKGEKGGGRGESVRVIACVPVVSWILITKKGHDDGNHYFNILKTAIFGEFWSEKGLIQVRLTFCAWRELAYSRAIDKSSGAGCSKVMDRAIHRINHYQI